MPTHARAVLPGALLDPDAVADDLMDGIDHDDALLVAAGATIMTIAISDALPLTMTVTWPMMLDEFRCVFGRIALGLNGSRCAVHDG